MTSPVQNRNTCNNEMSGSKILEFVGLEIIIDGVKAGRIYCNKELEGKFITDLRNEYKDKVKIKLSFITGGIITGEERNFVNAFVDDDVTFIYTVINSDCKLPRTVTKTGIRTCCTELKTSPISSMLQKERESFHHTDLHPESETLKHLLELSEKMTKVGLTLTPEQENTLLHNVIDELSAEIRSLKLKIEDLS